MRKRAIRPMSKFTCATLIFLLPTFKYNSLLDLHPTTVTLTFILTLALTLTLTPILTLTLGPTLTVALILTLTLTLPLTLVLPEKL